MTIHKVCFGCGCLGHKRDMIKYEFPPISLVDTKGKTVYFHPVCHRAIDWEETRLDGSSKLSGDNR